METAIAQATDQEGKAPRGGASKLIREVRNKNRKEVFNKSIERDKGFANVRFILLHPDTIIC